MFPGSSQGCLQTVRRHGKTGPNKEFREETMRTPRGAFHLRTIIGAAFMLALSACGTTTPQTATPDALKTIPNLIARPGTNTDRPTLFPEPSEKRETNAAPGMFNAEQLRSMAAGTYFTELDDLNTSSWRVGNIPFLRISLDKQYDTDGYLDQLEATNATASLNNASTDFKLPATVNAATSIKLMVAKPLTQTSSSFSVVLKRADTGATVGTQTVTLSSTNQIASYSEVSIHQVQNLNFTTSGLAANQAMQLWLTDLASGAKFFVGGIRITNGTSITAIDDLDFTKKNTSGQLVWRTNNLTEIKKLFTPQGETTAVGLHRLKPYLAAGGYVVSPLKAITSGQSITFNGTFAMPTTTTDKTISAYLQNATTFVQIPNSGQSITVSSIAKRLSFTVTKPLSVTGNVELVIGGIPFGQTLYLGNFKEPVAPPAGSVSYSISTDVLGWASINAKTTTPITSASGFVTATQPVKTASPGFLKDTTGQIIAADFLLPEKNSLTFNPENSARALVATNFIFTGWTQKGRAEAYRRANAETQFPQLVSLIAIAKKIPFTPAAMDLTTQIATSLALKMIAESPTLRGANLKPQTIIRNYPNLIPPYLGIANVVEPSPGQFYLQNKSLFNWNIIKTRTSDYPGNVPALLLNGQKTESCPDPLNPKCYATYSVNSTLDTPIPFIDSLLFANLTPALSPTFGLYDCSPHVIALSGTVPLDNFNSSDSARQNFITFLSKAISTVVVAPQLSAVDVDDLQKFLYTIGFFQRVDQLYKQASASGISQANKALFVSDLVRYVYETFQDYFSKKLGELTGDVVKFALSGFNQIAPAAIEAVLAKINFVENAIYVGQYAALAIIENVANRFSAAEVSNGKRELNGPDPTSINISAAPGASGQSSTAFTTPTSNATGCPIAYKAKLNVTASSGAAITLKLTQSGAISTPTVVGNFEVGGKLGPAGLLSLNVTYTCPTSSASLSGTLEVTHDATNISSPVTVPVTINCNLYRSNQVALRSYVAGNAKDFFDASGKLYASETDYQFGMFADNTFYGYSNLPSPNPVFSGAKWRVRIPHPEQFKGQWAQIIDAAFDAQVATELAKWATYLRPGFSYRITKGSVSGGDSNTAGRILVDIIKTP
jgi:hypothetical protein